MKNYKTKVAWTSQRHITPIPACLFVSVKALYKLASQPTTFLWVCNSSSLPSCLYSKPFLLHIPSLSDHCKLLTTSCTLISQCFAHANPSSWNSIDNSLTLFTFWPCTLDKLLRTCSDSTQTAFSWVDHPFTQLTETANIPLSVHLSIMYRLLFILVCKSSFSLFFWCLLLYLAIICLYCYYLLCF